MCIYYISMASYIQSDYLAKLLLPKQHPSQESSIRVKPNLTASNTITQDESKPTNRLDISTYTKGASSWSELDFTKDFLSSTKNDADTSEADDASLTSEADDASLSSEAENAVPDFTYLDPENMDLEYDFELCNTMFSNTAIYTIHICGYSISTECDLPFIKYLMELNGESFAFPHFDFTCPGNINNQSGFFKNIWNSLTGNEHEEEHEEDHDERTPGQTYFLNECFKRILSIMDASDHSDPDLLKTMYKGFISSKTEPNVLYVFFDFGDLYIKSNEFHRSWAIIDEIQYTKKMLGFSIDPKITNLFKQNPGLTHIIDKQGYITDIPYALYLCKRDEEASTILKNSYSDDNEDQMSVLEERCNHPVFGNFYLFSMNLLDLEGRESHFKIQRYACFTKNPLYILKNISNLTKEDRMVGTRDYGSIYFQEGSANQFWCIKSTSDFTPL